MSKNQEDGFIVTIVKLIVWIVKTINPLTHYKNLTNKELSVFDKIKKITPAFLLIVLPIIFINWYSSELKSNKEYDEKMRTLNGVYEYITSEKREFVSMEEYDTQVIKFKFLNDSTYIRNSFDKRSSELIKKEKGTFTIGKSKFLDSSEPFIYIKFKSFDWDGRGKESSDMALNLSGGFQIFTWSHGITTTSLHLIKSGGMDIIPFDEYGPRVYDNLSWDLYYPFDE